MIDLIKENGFTLKKKKGQKQIIYITDTDNEDDLVLLANTPAQAKFLLLSQEQAAGGIDLYIIANKIKYMYFKRKESFPL